MTLPRPAAVKIERWKDVKHTRFSNNFFRNKKKFTLANPVVTCQQQVSESLTR